MLATTRLFQSVSFLVQNPLKDRSMQGTTGEEVTFYSLMDKNNDGRPYRGIDSKFPAGKCVLIWDCVTMKCPCNGKKNFFLTMCQFSNYQWHDGSLGCHEELNMFLQGADKSWYLADICDAT